jgi:hypothetical protein
MIYTAGTPNALYGGQWFALQNAASAVVPPAKDKPITGENLFLP